MWLYSYTADTKMVHVGKSLLLVAMVYVNIFTNANIVSKHTTCSKNMRLVDRHGSPPLLVFSRSIIHCHSYCLKQSCYGFNYHEGRCQVFTGVAETEPLENGSRACWNRAVPETICDKADRIISTSSGNLCLIKITIPGDYHEQASLCQGLGGEVVMPTDEDFHNEIVSTYGSSDYLWIGLNQRRDVGTFQFFWKNSTPLGWTNWDGGQPNGFPNSFDFQDCVVYVSNKKWQDKPCRESHRTICQRYKI